MEQVMGQQEKEEGNRTMHDFIPEYYKSFLDSECLSVKKATKK